MTANHTDNLLEVTGVTRNFGKRTAVDNVSFQLKKGEVCAFLGPNGAGKTTLIKILTGLISPTSGSFAYHGKGYRADQIELKKLIGVVPQHNNIDRELTPRENLKVHGLLYKMRGKQLERRIEESLEFAGLQEHRDSPSEKLSGGMKRKLVIARALLHKPQLLFLDEPSVGLDPHSRRQMWSFLNTINQDSDCTIMLTTHYLEEAERLSRRVIFIEQGKLIADSTPDALKQALGSHVLDFGLSAQQEFFPSRELALARLKELDEAVSIREISLEDVFLKMTGKRLIKDV